MVSGGDTSLLREDESIDGWTPNVDTSESNELELACAHESRVISLQTGAWCDTLLSLVLYWLSTIMSIIEPHKHYPDKTQWKSRQAM